MKNNFFAAVVLFLISISPFVANGTIVEENKMADALAGLDTDTLVIFDIDSTILEPAQTLGSDAWYYTTIDRLISEGMDKEEAQKKILNQWMEVQKITDVIAVEANTPELIRQLQDKEIKIAVLTARPFKLIDVTIKQLNSIGVDFSRSPLSAKKIDVKSPGGKAKYRNGIIFCGGPKSDKGLILNEVLRKVKLVPNRVVFVDDRKNNVEAVDRALALNGIECKCVRYGAADRAYREYNRSVADIEMNFFNKVLSDDAAKAILTSQNKSH